MKINEMELQNLRHLILFNDNDTQKYSSYAETATDPNVKQYFQKAAQSATKNKQQLMQFLQ
jgi:type III secretory pathway component EscR